MRTVGRVLFYVLFIIPVLLAAGYGYHAWASSRDVEAYGPYGELVDVNGDAMHLHCVGEGSPTVVFEGGIGSVWLDWARVQPDVATFTRACSYDREGYGWSDPTLAERTVTQIARDLHALLRAAEESEPYILVGHAGGGLYMEAFNLLYEDEVAGIVFVDPLVTDRPSELLERLEGEDRQFVQDFLDEQFIDPDQRPPLNDSMYSMMSLGAPFGLGRVIVNATLGQTPAAYLPEGDKEAYRAAVSRTPALLSYAQELERTYDNLEYMRANRRPFDVPVTVIARGISATYDDDIGEMRPEQARMVEVSLKSHWAALEELAGLSDEGTFIIAEESGHYIPVVAPQLIVEAVRNLYDGAATE